MKLIYLRFVLSVILVNYAESLNTLPAYLDVCQRSDPNLNICVWNSIEKLRPKLIPGIENLHIPPMEPLRVSGIKVDQIAGPVYVKSQYKNIEVMGTSQFQIQNVQVNLNSNEFLLQVFFPTLNITSNYSITGKVMILPIAGNGLLTANFSDVIVTSLVSGERFLKDLGDGKKEEYFRVTDVAMKISIGGSRTHLANLFNGDEHLGQTMNNFLNLNWRLISFEVKPLMEESISGLLKEMANDFFNAFSYDQLFPK